MVFIVVAGIDLHRNIVSLNSIKASRPFRGKLPPATSSHVKQTNIGGKGRNPNEIQIVFKFHFQNLYKLQGLRCVVVNNAAFYKLNCPHTDTHNLVLEKSQLILASPVLLNSI